MTERMSYKSEYEHMSPQQRNTALKSLLEALPDFRIWRSEGETIEEIMEDSPGSARKNKELYEKREKSQYRANLLNRFDALMSFAVTTTSFNKYLRIEFEEYSLDGIEKDEEEMIDYYGEVFQWNNPLSAGAFSKETAKEVDRDFYRHIIDVKLMGKESIDQIFKDLGEDMTTEELLEDAIKHNGSEYHIAFLRKRLEEQKIIRDWRLEYIEKYKEEP